LVLSTFHQLLFSVFTLIELVELEVIILVESILVAHLPVDVQLILYLLEVPLTLAVAGRLCRFFPSHDRHGPLRVVGLVQERLVGRNRLILEVRLSGTRVPHIP